MEGDSATAPGDFALDRRWSSIEEIIAMHGDALRLDLGCGYAKPEGYVGVDNVTGIPSDQSPQEASGQGPDVLLDLNRARLPFPADSCVEVRARHFLEHSVLDHIFSETWRVLRPGGRFTIIVPYANSAWGMFPGHTIFLTERFFAENESFRKRFAIDRLTYRQDEAWEAWPWWLRRLIPYRWARLHLYNVCKEMRIEASAVKPGP